MGRAEEEAGEYHWKDFEWDLLRQQVESNPSYRHHLLLPPPLNPLPQEPEEEEEEEQATDDDDDPKAWQRFHRRHSSGKFFKERRYLLKEFPELVSCRGAPSKLLELGCGNGSSVIPILRGNDSITVYACDCSAEILATAKETIESSNIEDVQRRFHTFQCDFTSDSPLKELNFDSRQGTYRCCHQERCSSGDGLCFSEKGVIGGVDFVTLIFSLSAVPFKRMPRVIENCYSVLKPGGMLFFRDYGLYDMTMLRFEPDKKVGFREYMRSDGTRSYFFCLDTVKDLFRGAGFVEIELEFCCVKSVNRQKGRSLERVWVHGKFQRPYINTGEAQPICS